MSETILVIKHGALGDIIQALGAFESIRRHHDQAHICGLTTPGFALFLEKTGYFDEIIIDSRPPITHFATWFNTIKALRKRQFDRVYDLQWSTRTSWYYRKLSFGRDLEWSGVAKGCSHPHPNPQWKTCKAYDRLTQQISSLDIPVHAPHFNWLEHSAKRPESPYLVFIPGCSAHHLEKRWTVEGYQELAQYYRMRGYRVVLVGTEHEAEVGQQIEAACPEVDNYMGKTSLWDLIDLCRHSVAAVGGDTGPTHIAAISGVPTLALFFKATNPAISGPVGPQVQILQKTQATDLTVEEVTQTLNTMLNSASEGNRRG